MTEALDTSAAGPAARITDWTVFKGLLWRQWLAGRGLALWAVGIWLAGLWALELFFHPGFILAFGVIYAFMAGPVIGGSEAAEGSEEFAFSLPPTRGMRYLANLVITAGPLLVLTGVGALAIAGDWPQVLWRLVVDSGFTEPFPAVEETFLYPLAVAAPLAVLAFSLAIGSLAGTRWTAAASGLLGLLAAGAVLGAGFLLETLLWDRLTGVISICALLGLGAAALEVGYLLYIRKEGVSRPAPLGGRRLWWLWILLAAVVAFALFVFALRATDRPPAPPTTSSLSASSDPHRAVESSADGSAVGAPAEVPVSQPPLAPASRVATSASAPAEARGKPATQTE